MPKVAEPGGGVLAGDGCKGDGDRSVGLIPGSRSGTEHTRLRRSERRFKLNASSIGVTSGEYGGRIRIRAPRRLHPPPGLTPLVDAEVVPTHPIARPALRQQDAGAEALKGHSV